MKPVTLRVRRPIAPLAIVDQGWTDPVGDYIRCLARDAGRHLARLRHERRLLQGPPENQVTRERGVRVKAGLWLLLGLPSLLQAQQTGPYHSIRVFTMGDTTVTEYVRGNVDSVRRVFPITPVPTPTPTPTPQPIGTGIPFGCSGCLEADPGYPVTLSQDSYNASNIVSRIAAGRARGAKLVMNILGGAHTNFVTSGKWDASKAQARLNTYNTPAIRAAVAKGVADGIILGASVMDEPQQCGPAGDVKAWGPCGPNNAPYLTKPVIDGLCAKVKAIFPTLAVGVVHDAGKFWPETGYQTCDLIASQYRLSKGDALTFAKESKAFTDKYHMGLVLMLNYLHGGTPGSSCPKYGDEASDNLCPMSASQVKTWGLAFGKVACAVSGYRWEEEYHTRSDIQTAIKTVADSLKKLPGRSCRRAA